MAKPYKHLSNEFWDNLKDHLNCEMDIYKEEIKKLPKMFMGNYIEEEDNG